MQHDAACLLWYHILSGPSARESIAAAGAVPACTRIVSNPDSTPLDQTCALGEASCLTAASYALHSAAGYKYNNPPVAGTALCHVHLPYLMIVMVAASMVVIHHKACLLTAPTFCCARLPLTVPRLQGFHFTSSCCRDLARSSTR